ncbi:hypothetical protein JCM10212_001446 [Sporobolomyces blumeae]
MTSAGSTVPARPVKVSPELAIDLRLRFLEALVSSRPSRYTQSRPTPPSLARRVSLLEAELKSALDSNASTEAVRRFVQNYDYNAPLLSIPPVPAAPDELEVTPQAKVALTLEAEHELRQLERGLREIETLEQRGVVEAGKLPEHEALVPRLEQLETNLAPIVREHAAIEQRTTTLLQRYNDHIATLSELFVAWNDIITEAEDAVDRLEKQRNQPLDIS